MPITEPLVADGVFYTKDTLPDLDKTIFGDYCASTYNFLVKLICKRSRLVDQITADRKLPLPNDHAIYTNNNILHHFITTASKISTQAFTNHKDFSSEPPSQQPDVYQFKNC